MSSLNVQGPRPHGPLPRPLAPHRSAFCPYESDGWRDLESFRVCLLALSITSSRSVLVVAGGRIPFLHKAESHPTGTGHSGCSHWTHLGSQAQGHLVLVPQSRAPSLLTSPHAGLLRPLDSGGGAIRWRNRGTELVPTSSLPVPQEGRHLFLGA